MDSLNSYSYAVEQKQFYFTLSVIVGIRWNQMIAERMKKDEVEMTTTLNREQGY